MMRRLAHSLVFLALAAAGLNCGPSPTTRPSQPPPGMPPVATPPMAGPPAAAPASAAPTATTPGEPDALKGVLQPIATSNLQALSLIGWQRGQPVVGHTGWGQKILSGVDESGRYIVDEREWQGINTSVLVGSAGDFADDVLLYGFSDTGRAVGEGVLYARSKGGRWRTQRVLPFLQYFSGVHTWSKGRTLAMIHQGGIWRPQPKAPRFEIVAGPRGGRDVPALTLGKTVDMMGNPYKGAIVDPRLMVAFESGHVYALGLESLEWFSPGQRKGVIVKAPAGLDIAQKFAKHGERTLFLAGSPAITKIDGDSIESITVPSEPGKDDYDTNVAVTQDGTLWFARSNGGLYRMHPGETWVRIAIPRPDGLPEGQVKVRSLAALGDHVWIAASALDGAGTSVVRSFVAWDGPKPAELSRIVVPGNGWEQVQIATSDLKRPKPAASGCDSVFALFYGITKYAGPDYDFPKTREALKGKTQFASARFVKTEVQGQQYFGAFAKDLAQGRELIKLIAEDVEGSTPQLLCHEPHVVAELGIDLSTGASKGWTPVK